MQKLIIFLFICYNQAIFLGEKPSAFEVFKQNSGLRKKCRDVFFSDKFISNEEIAKCVEINFLFQGGGVLILTKPSKSKYDDFTKLKLSKWDDIALAYKVWGR